MPRTMHNSWKRSNSSAVRRKLIVLFRDALHIENFRVGLSRARIDQFDLISQLAQMGKLDGQNPVTVDFDGDRTLQHHHGDDHAPTALLF